jgi:hypothetical protein
MFLLHQWDSVLDFKEAAMIEAKDLETRLTVNHHHDPYL